MMFLDTCTCIEFLRGNLPYALEKMQECNPAQIGIPAVVEAELYLGTLKSAYPDENKSKVDLFLAPFERISFDSKCAEAYAHIRSTLKTKGNVIGPNDLLVAATALVYGATLVTSNVREFSRVEGLSLESWAEIAL